MPQYVFDLDLTLYSQKDFKDTENEVEYYNSFQPKLKLANLLKNTTGRKYILTNANIAHVDEVLDKLQLKNIFDDMMSSDVADSYKPEGSIYHISNHICVPYVPCLHMLVMLPVFMFLRLLYIYIMYVYVYLNLTCLCYPYVLKINTHIYIYFI